MWSTDACGYTVTTFTQMVTTSNLNAPNSQQLKERQYVSLGGIQAACQYVTCILQLATAAENQESLTHSQQRLEYPCSCGSDNLSQPDSMQGALTEPAPYHRRVSAGTTTTLDKGVQQGRIQIRQGWIYI